MDMYTVQKEEQRWRILDDALKEFLYKHLEGVNQQTWDSSLFFLSLLLYFYTAHK